MSVNEERYLENYICLSFADFIEDEKKLYFSNRTFNALVIVNKASWEVEELLPFEGEALNRRELHLYCCRWKNKIVFLPQGDRPIHIYDMDSGRQTRYDLEGEGIPNMPWYKHLCQDKLYLLPCVGEAGLWSLDDRERIARESWWEPETGRNTLVHGSLEEQRFYTLEVDTNHLAVTDLSSRESRHYQLPDEKVFRITYDGQSFWYITSNNTKIVRWIPEQGVVESYDFPQHEVSQIGALPYRSIHPEEGRIFLSSGNGQTVFWLNREENRLEKIIELPELSSRYTNVGKEVFYTRREEKLVCTFRNMPGMIVIDLHTLGAQWYPEVLKTNGKVQDYFDRVLFQCGPLLMEDKADWNLEKYLKYCL